MMGGDGGGHDRINCGLRVLLVTTSQVLRRPLWSGAMFWTGLVKVKTRCFCIQVYGPHSRPKIRSLGSNPFGHFSAVNGVRAGMELAKMGLYR